MDNEIKKESGFAKFLVFFAWFVWIGGFIWGLGILASEPSLFITDKVQEYLGVMVIFQSFFIGTVFYGIGKLINLAYEIRLNQNPTFKENSEEDLSL